MGAFALAPQAVRGCARVFRQISVAKEVRSDQRYIIFKDCSITTSCSRNRRFDTLQTEISIMDMVVCIAAIHWVT